MKIENINTHAEWQHLAAQRAKAAALMDSVKRRISEIEAHLATPTRSEDDPLAVLDSRPPEDRAHLWAELAAKRKDAHRLAIADSHLAQRQATLNNELVGRVEAPVVAELLAVARLAGDAWRNLLELSRREQSALDALRSAGYQSHGLSVAIGATPDAIAAEIERLDRAAAVLAGRASGRAVVWPVPAGVKPDKAGLYAARVLHRCAHGDINDVALLTREALELALFDGEVDPNPEAVAVARLSRPIPSAPGPALL